MRVTRIQHLKPTPPRFMELPIGTVFERDCKSPAEYYLKVDHQQAFGLKFHGTKEFGLYDAVKPFRVVEIVIDEASTE